MPEHHRRTSLTESITSFRNLRAPLLRAALEEVHGFLARGGTRRDQLLVDFARCCHKIPNRSPDHISTHV